MKSVAAESSAVGKPAAGRRRRYLIRPAFQCRYAISVALMVFAISCMMTIVLYGILHQQARLRSMHPTSYVATVPPVVWLSGLAFASLTALGVGAWCIIVTHRICGPIHVMEGALRQLAQGRVPKLRSLRSKDELQDFYKVFCDAMHSLESTREQELAALTDALRSARQAARADGGGCREALASVSSGLERLRLGTAAALGREGEDVPAPRAVERRGEPVMPGIGRH